MQSEHRATPAVNVRVLTLDTSVATRSVPHCTLANLFKVEKPSPRSSPTSRRESPLVSVMRTASLPHVLNQPWQRNEKQSGSGEPGAVHSRPTTWSPII